MSKYYSFALHLVLVISFAVTSVMPAMASRALVMNEGTISDTTIETTFENDKIELVDDLESEISRLYALAIGMTLDDDVSREHVELVLDVLRKITDEIENIAWQQSYKD